MQVARRRRSITNNRNKNGKVGKVLHSRPGRCTVCHRSWAEVELHPYSSQRMRLFCHRDRYVAEAMRILDWHRETGYDPTTVATQSHLPLIELLEGKLSYEDIARVVIWAAYHEMPRS